MRNIIEMNLPGLIEVNVQEWSYIGQRLHLRFNTARELLNAAEMIRSRGVACHIERSELIINPKNLKG